MSAPIARWTIQANLDTVTATHLGGGEGNTADMVVVVDPGSGRPMMAGTTVAGLLRHHLAASCHGHFHSERDGDPGTILFGVALGGDDGGHQSAVVTFDAVAEPGLRPLEIRDGVALDAASGTAKDHKKYDYEVIPPGTRFGLRLELGIDENADEDNLVAWLARALLGFQDSEIRLGARTSRGMGQVRAADWRVARFPLDTEGAWCSWLATDHVDPGAGVEPCADLLDALGRAGGAPVVPAGSAPAPTVVVELPLAFESPLLIGAPASMMDGPDVAHLTSAGRPVLSGTSAAGVLRHRAWTIAELVHGETSANALVEWLFGPTLGDRDTATEDRPRPHRSRVRIDEQFVDRPAVDVEGASGAEQVGRWERRTRIGVDRFTGGVLSGRLFDQQPYVGAQTLLRVELRTAQIEADKGLAAVAAGLLVFVARDVIDGFVTFGGDEAIGSGLASAAGPATVTVADGIVTSGEGTGDLYSPLAEDLVRAFCSWRGALGSRPIDLTLDPSRHASTAGGGAGPLAMPATHAAQLHEPADQEEPRQ